MARDAALVSKRTNTLIFLLQLALGFTGGLYAVLQGFIARMWAMKIRQGSPAHYALVEKRAGDRIRFE